MPLSQLGCAKCIPGLLGTGWDLGTSSGAASMVQEGSPALQCHQAAFFECPNCSHGFLGFPLQPILINYILPSGFEGIISHLASCPQKTARTSMALRGAFFGEHVRILLFSDLVKDQLLPERYPSNLISSEFKSSLF